MKAKAENLSKVNEHLDKEFGDFVYEPDKNPERAPLLVSKATVLKRKSNENEDLEETGGNNKSFGRKTGKSYDVTFLDLLPLIFVSLRFVCVTTGEF